MDARPIIVITGPTASGKSHLALPLARKYGGEIVSVDSMQVYRKLDIGTAKPTRSERQEVPHHLVDIIDPKEHFSVARFQRLAYAAIEDILARGRLPFMVGGTMLYIKAMIEGYAFSDVRPDPTLRRFLRARAQQMGSEGLHEYLANRDPAAAERIHGRDLRRIVRALEVYYAKEQSVTVDDTNQRPELSMLVMALHWPRTELYARIEERVDQMVEDGLVEEVKGLYAQGYADDLRRIRALGYREIGFYLQGQCSLSEAVRLLKRNTRRYAKRQLTWLRRFEGIKLLEAGQNRATEEILVDASKLVQEACLEA